MFCEVMLFIDSVAEIGVRYTVRVYYAQYEGNVVLGAASFRANDIKGPLCLMKYIGFRRC